MSRLTGRRIIITGGASGIGRATAALFATEGAALAVLDRDAAPADAVARSVGGHAFAVDVADVFINRGLMETGPDAWHLTIAVNLTGTFLCVQAAVPFLRRSERSTIVNLGSGVGLLPTGGGSTAYVASKGV